MIERESFLFFFFWFCFLLCNKEAKNKGNFKGYNMAQWKNRVKHRCLSRVLQVFIILSTNTDEDITVS